MSFGKDVESIDKCTGIILKAIEKILVREALQIVVRDCCSPNESSKTYISKFVSLTICTV